MDDYNRPTAIEIAIETLVYLDDFSDEVMPCAPDLEAWAQYLHLGTEDDPGPHAKHGEEFKGSVVELLDNVVAERDGSGWRVNYRPQTATQYALRYGPDLGWDADTLQSTVDEVLALCDGEDEPVYIACLRDDDHRRYRFTLENGVAKIEDIGPDETDSDHSGGTVH